MKKIVYCIWIAIYGMLMNFSVSGQSNRANEFDYIGSSHNSVIESFFSEYSPERVRSENLKIDGLNDYIWESWESKRLSLSRACLNNLFIGLAWKAN